MLISPTSISDHRVVHELSRLVDAHGKPGRIISDNGTEFTSNAVLGWCRDSGVDWWYIRPGKPVENAYVESFHSRLRDECLSARWFLDVPDARGQIEAWRRDYNEVRPHTRLDGRTPAEFTALYAEDHTMTRLSA